MARKIDMGEDLYNKLTAVRFELKGKTYEIDIGEELLIDEDDLHSQVERIPAVMGYFGSIVSLLNREWEDKKIIKKKIEAHLDKQVRESGIIGETRIDKMIKRQSKWLDAGYEVNKAKHNYERAKNLFISLKEKSISLMSRSNDIRTIPSDSIRGVGKKDIINVKSS
jgi:hypothetical protein